MKKTQQLYAGKAKTIYLTDEPQYLILEFRDDMTAFNGVKHERFPYKGAINNQINAFMMQKLSAAGIKTHFVRRLNATESIVRNCEMIRVEAVIRNIAAGNLCKRLGITPGITLAPPLFEFFLKDDALGDPMITADHILTFHWASVEEIQQIRALTYQVNDILFPFFLQAGLLLVDYKLEFGRCDGQLVLCDEFSPDGCRIWDAETKEILDKDRFRQDLGRVIESYEAVAKRLGVTIDKN